ncbi:hypothetical protein B0A49_00441 [Cryomyces minteri]|uniref:Altered inheritance of mitochondria protein 11 n=1 Tax=Cryomyces minteri TaxID=331657 RepID=A0A4U0Y1R7_9PEZI|nr:hypothetical protein B0A49_00441 [Cryomyces minteri]
MAFFLQKFMGPHLPKTEAQPAHDQTTMSGSEPLLQDQTPPAPATAVDGTPPADLSTAFTSPRSRRQLSLFLAGATFFTFSTLLTRRALLRRHALTKPNFYAPSNRPAPDVNGAIEAFEALNLATINVVSFGMMMTGGLLWSYDISSLEDLRRKVRGGLGVDGSGKSEMDAEEEMEEWLATVLARKEDKEKRRKREGIVEEERPRTNERGAPR